MATITVHLESVIPTKLFVSNYRNVIMIIGTIIELTNIGWPL